MDSGGERRRRRDRLAGERPPPHAAMPRFSHLAPPRLLAKGWRTVNQRHVRKE